MDASDGAYPRVRDSVFVEQEQEPEASATSAGMNMASLCLLLFFILYMPKQVRQAGLGELFFVSSFHEGIGTVKIERLGRF